MLFRIVYITMKVRDSSWCALRIHTLKLLEMLLVIKQIRKGIPEDACQKCRFLALPQILTSLFGLLIIV